MPDYTPLHKPAQTITLTASANVVGGQLLSITGDLTAGPTGAAGTSVVGVAGHDAAAGQRVTVHTLVGAVHIITAAAAITAGATLKGAATGQVTPWVSGTDAADLKVGVALAAAASGAPATFLSLR